VKGADHPLALYREAGVPVVLSTDDEGVSRIDMTNEYLRAAAEHGLKYSDLKAMARDSLEYAFLPGQKSLGVRTRSSGELRQARRRMRGLPRQEPEGRPAVAIGARLRSFRAVVLSPLILYDRLLSSDARTSRGGTLGPGGAGSWEVQMSR
jgi:hypothetical protein